MNVEKRREISQNRYETYHIFDQLDPEVPQMYCAIHDRLKSRFYMTDLSVPTSVGLCSGQKINHLVSDDICGKSVFDSASKVVLSSCGRRLCVPVPLCGSERWLCRLFFG